jgi:predicted O-linked N-acetylglucosamine transferase (SPINDLY family)
MISVEEAFARASAHDAAGRRREARAIYEQVLAAMPDHPGALLRIALGEARDGRLEPARTLLERAAASAARQRLASDEIWMALGRVHLARKDTAAARAAFGKARALGRRAPDAYRLGAWLALEAGDTHEARTLCRIGLDGHPRDAELLHLLGKTQKAEGSTGAALASLTQAAAASNDDPVILVSLGAVLLDAGRPAEARDALRRAIANGQDTAIAWDNLGLALARLASHEEAASAFEHALARDPSLTPALANLVSALRYACRWDESIPRERELLARAAAGDPNPRWGPFVYALDATPREQRAILAAWSRATLPPAAAPRVVRQRGTRLAIGYLTADFHDHATAHLMAGMLERHDRGAFDVHAYDYGPDDGSAMRRRVVAACEHFADVRTLSDADCAERIRADGIDVLIELKGHTAGGRLGILASRPAPLQLHFLGYPTTIGYDAVDGIIADAEVVPPGAEADYHERVWRLPRCYYPIDDRRPLPAPTPRAALDLPEDALVLQCFNQPYKLTRPFFAAWMAVLARHPDALLWLYALPEAQRNLRAEAKRAGVDPARLRFASRVSQEEHLARLAAADVALDTLPYGAHTTGSDALWMGVPLVTCRGNTFVGRVGASMLDAAGLPELVTDSLPDYEALLQALASDRTRLLRYREHLERERTRLPLFDTAGFTRDFEALVARAHEETLAARGR